MDRVIGDQDVILTPGAIDNVRKIAAKYSGLVDKAARDHFNDAREVAFDRMSVERYHELDAERMTRLRDTAAVLLHGLSYLLEAARGGTVTPEDETSLIGCGRMTVGLIDHGDNWSAHS